MEHMPHAHWSMALQARLASLKREEEWLHKEQERLEADKAQHIRFASDSTGLWCCMSTVSVYQETTKHDQHECPNMILCLHSMCMIPVT